MNVKNKRGGKRVIVKLPVCLFNLARPGERPLFMRKAKFASFIDMQRQKLKFTSVQINKKQVS